MLNYCDSVERQGSFIYLLEDLFQLPRRLASLVKNHGGCGEIPHGVFNIKGMGLYWNNHSSSEQSHRTVQHSRKKWCEKGVFQSPQLHHGFSGVKLSSPQTEPTGSKLNRCQTWVHPNNSPKPRGILPTCNLSTVIS